MTYVPAPYAPPPVLRRPPLPVDLRRAARRAGGIGFSLMTVGWALFAAAAVCGIVWGVFATISQRDERVARGLGEVVGFFSGVPVAVLIGAVALVGLLGVAIWIIGLVASHGILRRSGHPHPWGVTMAGFGLALIASWIGQWISYAFGQIVNAITIIPYYSDPMRSPTDSSGIVIGYAVGGAAWVLLSIALAAVAGALLWWAMAVAMRPGAPATVAHSPAAPSA